MMTEIKRLIRKATLRMTGQSTKLYKRKSIKFLNFNITNNIILSSKSLSGDSYIGDVIMCSLALKKLNSVFIIELVAFHI